MYIHSLNLNTQETWIAEVRTAWKVDPGLVVYLPERFKNPTVEREAGRWIRAHAKEFLDHPAGLHFIIGERLDHGITRDLKASIISLSMLLPSLTYLFSMRSAFVTGEIIKVDGGAMYK